MQVLRVAVSFCYKRQALSQILEHDSNILKLFIAVVVFHQIYIAKIDVFDRFKGSFILLLPDTLSKGFPQTLKNH